jgi:hypothetical protein
MARFNTVQLGSIYFTKTGAAGGTPCKLSVAGLAALKKARAASVRRDLKNIPYRQQSNFAGKGFDIAITVETLPKTVFDSINAAISAAETNQTTLALEILGDTGNFALTVIPGADPIKFAGEFINGRVKGVTYSFVTA